MSDQVWDAFKCPTCGALFDAHEEPDLRWCDGYVERTDPSHPQVDLVPIKVVEKP